MEAAASEATGSPVKRGMAVRVVSRAFLRIAEDFVSFAKFFELLFRGLIAGIFVRMIFYGQFAVGFFDFIGARAFLETENLIVIAFGHGSGSRFFGDHDAGGAEQTLAEFVTFAKLLHDRAFRNVRTFFLRNRFMEVRIE